MKKVLTMVLLPFLLASCTSVKLVSTKKLPETATGAVIRAQNVSGALKTMNPEIPLEEHAYVIPTDSIQVDEVPGRIGVFPHGNNVIQLKSPYGKLSKKDFAFLFGAGKYYSFEVSKFSRSMSTVELIEVLTDEERLERAKHDVVGIKEYLEYRNDHPNALDGTYKGDRSTIVIKDSRLYFATIKGMEILYDGETIILSGDGKYKFNDYCSNIWYYHFNSDGNLEIILNANKILEGFSNVVVFKPVP